MASEGREGWGREGVTRITGEGGLRQGCVWLWCKPATACLLLPAGTVGGCGCGTHDLDSTWKERSSQAIVHKIDLSLHLPHSTRLWQDQDLGPGQGGPLPANTVQSRPRDDGNISAPPPPSPPLLVPDLTDFLCFVHMVVLKKAGLFGNKGEHKIKVRRAPNILNP